MFDHIAKRSPPSRVPIAAIAVVIVGVVMVAIMVRTLAPSRDQEERRRASGLHPQVSAPLPGLSPKLEAQVTGEPKRLDVKFGWRPLGPPDNATKHFRREATVRVALDPATSRVHRARTEMTVEVADQRRTTVEDIAFDWAHAEGCGTKAL